MAAIRKALKRLRLGRRRQAGRRQPAGRPHKPREDPRLIVLRQPHRQGDERPERGSALGRLRLAGAITPQQEAAGHTFAALWQAVMAVGGISGVPASPLVRLARSTGDGRGLPLNVEDAVRQEWAKARGVLRQLELERSMIFLRVCWLELEPSFGDDLEALAAGLQGFHDVGLQWP